MKRKLYLIGLVSSLLYFGSCQNSTTTSDKTNAEQTKPEQTVSKEASKGKYQIKSGVVTYETETMGMKQSMVLNFDEYGKKEMNETSMTMMGITVKNRNFTKDGYAYTIDMTKKTGTKMKIPTANDPNNIDFSALTDDMVKEMGLKKEGSESFLGKTCEKWSINNTKYKMTGTYLVWNGIQLKTDMSVMGMKVKMTATKIEENVAVPATQFEVPAGVTITETSMKMQ